MLKDNAYLLDMLQAAGDVQRFLHGVDEARFRNDQILHYAVIQRLTVIGEAASKISRTTRDASPEIPWKAIIGMRNILVHVYGDVKLDIVWKAATDGIARLIAAVEPLVPPDTGDDPIAQEPNP